MNKNYFRKSGNITKISKLGKNLYSLLPSVFSRNKTLTIVVKS